MRLYRLFGLLAVVCLAGCGGGSAEQASDARSRTQVGADEGLSANIEYQVLDTDLYSAIGNARTVVVEDAASWDALWREHKQNRFPVPPAPAVNFFQQTVIGVFLGDRLTGCYSVEIRRVYAQNETVLVEYKEHEPPEGAMCTQALTAPSQLVAIPRTSRQVRFVKVA